jgi:hypothetical protein
MAAKQFRSHVTELSVRITTHEYIQALIQEDNAVILGAASPEETQRLRNRVIEAREKRDGLVRETELLREFWDKDDQKEADRDSAG